MPTLSRFGVSLDHALLKAFDRRFSGKGFASRSQAIAELIRCGLVEQEWTQRSGTVIGVVTLVYDPSHHVLSHTLTRTEHQHHERIVSSQHIHLGEHDCLEVLVPILQRALADYLHDPDATTALLVELSAGFGDADYDAALAHAALELADSEDLLGTRRDRAFGELDMGRIRDLLEEGVPAWKKAEVAVPGGLQAEDIATNRFIDGSID